MKTNLYLKGGASQINKQLLVLRREEGDSFVLVTGHQDVAKGDVLEALALTDIIIWRRGAERRGEEGGPEGMRGRGGGRKRRNDVKGRY